MIKLLHKDSRYQLMNLRTNMLVKLSFLILFLTCIFAQELQFYNESHAVIIGINNYQSETVPDLGYAAEDAKSIAELLINKLGFNETNIHLLLNENATKINIMNKLYEVAIAAGKNDRILVFYGGHGETISLPSGGEVGYLLPVNANRNNLYTSGLSMQEFKQISEITPAKHVLYLVDACYGGIMTVGTRSLSKEDFGDNEKYIRRITTQPARQIITAGGKGEEAQERPIWGHSAFTKELLSAIDKGLADSDNDGFITADELGIYLNKKVYITSEENQTPVKGRYGSGEGEFVFINPSYIEEIVEEKVDDVLSASPPVMIDNSQTERTLSEINNSLTLMWKMREGGEKSGILTFDENNQYLDSTFVYPFMRHPDAKSLEFITKYINPYYDIKNLRFSTAFIPYWLEYTRVSGFEMGPQILISQLKPIATKLEYYPIYNFSMNRFYQYARITRHPWGNKDHNISIEYDDKIGSNDQWMRDINLNGMSSWLFGKDYMDHFHNKGLSVNHTYKFTDKISLVTKYQNTHQTYLPTIKKYKNSILKKAALDNRSNFNTAPYPFEDGRHTNMQTVITINQLNRTMQMTFTCTVKSSDSSRNILNQPSPTVYLIPESKGWPDEKYKMKRPAFGNVKEVTQFAGGLIEVNLAGSIEDTSSALKTDSIYQVQYFYEVTVNLPPGSHAYRFLIDSTLYQIDDINEKAIISDGKAVSIVSIDIPYRFDIGYEFSDISLGGDFSYERITLNYSTIYTLSDKDAVQFRLIGGWSRKHLPVQKLFYIGGEGSVRGFDYMDTKKFSGKQMLLTKMEYHYFGLPYTNAFLFCDAAVIGNKFNFQSPIISYGIGAGPDIRLIKNASGPDDIFGIIVYKNQDSNNGNWGIEIIYSYFLNQFEEDVFILP